jgi:Holliday junction resolvasome RuvABC endonuclease subunit
MIKYAKDGENVLVLDPSSEHMAYCIVNPLNGVFNIIKCGMIYCSSGWTMGKKLNYIYDAIMFLVLDNSIKHIITEAFFIPFGKRQMGVTIIPTINNILKMLAYNIFKETGGYISVIEVPTTTWRKWLGSGSVKDDKGKRDFKEPCRVKVIEHLGDILPQDVMSNTNLKPRKLPHDITDCLGIAIAHGLELRYPKIVASPDLFNDNKTLNILNSLI